MAVKIMRNQVADFLSKTETEAYWFMGVGFTALNESPGAQTESETYINDVTASSYIKGYETSFAYESKLIKDENAVMAMYEVGRDHLTGSAAEFFYVRADLWDPLPDSPNTFKARKFIVACEVSDNNGDPASPMSISGNLNCVGDPIFGTFNTTTKTFTADTATPPVVTE